MSRSGIWYGRWTIKAMVPEYHGHSNVALRLYLDRTDRAISAILAGCREDSHDCESCRDATAFAFDNLECAPVSRWIRANLPGAFIGINQALPPCCQGGPNKAIIDDCYGFQFLGWCEEISSDIAAVFDLERHQRIEQL